MRTLFTILLVSLVAACSTTGFSNRENLRGPFTVVGIGHSEELARRDGFKKAVEYSMGVAIQTERVVKNDTVGKNYILTHSSGYVDDFKIKNVTKVGNMYEVQMEVFVKPTYLDDYVIKSADKNFSVEGEKLKESLTSFNEERKTGDDMLMSVLKDYPEKSFDLIAQPVTFKVDADRVLYAEVKYKLKWSDSYLRSLSQTLKMVSDSDCKFMCDTLASYRVSYKKGKDDWVNTNDTIYFKDATRPQLVYKYLRGAHFPAVYSKSQQKHANVRYVVKVDFLDFNKDVVNTSCIYSSHARKQDYWGGEQFFIDYKILTDETFKIIIKRGNWVSDHHKNLDKYANINVSVVRPDMCKDL